MMKKRWISFLCLLLAVVLPMTSLASTMEHTLTITPGDALIPHLQGIESLFDALKVSILSNAEDVSGALVLSLDDTEVLKVAARPNRTGLFAQSDAVSEQAVFVTWEDAIGLLEANTYPTWETMQMLAMVKKLLGEARNGNLETLVLGAGQKALQKVGPVMQTIAEDAELHELLASICVSKEVHEASANALNRDMGDTVISVHITTVDCMRFLELDTAKAIIAAALSEFVAPDDLDRYANILIMMAKRQIETMKIDLKVEAVTSMGRIVSMNASSKIADQYDSYVEFSANYDRATTIDGFNHICTLNIDSGGYVYIPYIQMRFEMMDYKDDKVDGVYYMVCDGVQAALAFGKTATNDVVDYTLDAYVRDKVSVVSALYDFETPVVSLRLTSKPVITPALDGIKQSVGKNSIQILRLSETELSEFTENAIVNATHAALIALSHIPNDIIRLVVKDQMGR